MSKLLFRVIVLIAALSIFALSQSAMALVVPDGDLEGSAIAADGWEYMSAHTGIDTSWTDTGYPNTWIANTYTTGSANYGYPVMGHSGAQWMDMNGSYVHQSLTDTYVEGETYILSIWATTTYTGQGLYFYFTDGTGNDGWTAAPLLFDSGAIAVTQQASPASVWEQYSAEYTATAADAGKNIGIAIYGRTNTWADDITLEILSFVVATDPDPADGATDIPVDTNLGWIGPVDYVANHYDINYDIGAGMVTYVSDASTTWDPPANANYLQVCSWQIVSYEDPNIAFPLGIPHPGPVWSFTTEDGLPTITEQPVGGTVAGGSEVILTVSATGGGTLDYQWYHNDSPVGTDSNSYTIASAGVSDEGEYRCDVGTNTPGVVDVVESNTVVLLTERLLHHWTFDTDGSDSADNPVAGTLLGDPNIVAGEIGNAIEFYADEDDSVEFGAAGDIAIGTSDFSVSLWINTTDPTTFGTFIANQDWASGWNTGWGLYDYNGDMRLVMSDTAGRTDVAAATAYDGQWHMLTATNDRDGNASLYVDGSLAATDDISDLQGTLTSIYPLTLGEDGLGNYPYSGKIDDVRIYSYVMDANGVAGIYGKAVVMTDPEDQAIDDPGNATFTVTTLNVTTWQWYSSTDPNTNTSIDDIFLVDGGIVGGATTATLTLTGATIADELYYYCVVSGGGGSDTSNTAALRTKRLIAHWELDETTGTEAADIAIVSQTSGPHTATLVNTTFDSNSVPGPTNLGTALRFDASNSDYAWATIDVSETEYAVSLWFRTDVDGENGGVFTADGGGSDRFISVANGQVYATVWNAISGHEWINSTGLDVDDGAWHHVVHTFGGAIGGQRLYVDGRLEATGTLTISDFDWQTIIYLGWNYYNGYFDGEIDDVQIYTRSLSDAEIWAAYYASNGTFCAVSNPLDVSGPTPGEPDCKVDFYDMTVFAEDWWLACGRYPVSTCGL